MGETMLLTRKVYQSDTPHLSLAKIADVEKKNVLDAIKKAVISSMYGKKYKQSALSPRDTRLSCAGCVSQALMFTRPEEIAVQTI